MNIVVFGSTGRVGSSFTAKAATAGHQVVAFARRIDMVKVEGVHRFQGDVRDRDAVRTALSQGCDAVVCCIGEAGLKPSTIVTDAFTSIVGVMTNLGIKRFLAVSGSAEMKQMTVAGKIYTSILQQTPVGHAIRDHDGGLKVVQQSSLEWTIAGCNYLSDGPELGRYKTSLIFPGGFKKIHPADVAAFLLKETEVPTFRNAVVGIWY
jgi:putative NADH-flavin reductase